jgi:hypothetical protein
MAKSTNRKVHPGLTIDPAIWEEFKKKYSDNVSKEIESLMEQAVHPPQNTVQYLSSTPVGSIAFDNADQWSINLANNMINVVRTEAYYCVSSGTSDKTQTYTTSSINLKDVIIK